MGALIVVDALWGDSGKGKISAYLSKRENTPLCIRAGVGTNAGHSLYLSEEEIIKTQQLPMGFLNPTTQLAIGSGVAVDPNIFHREVDRYQLHEKVKVDGRCPIITEEHIQREKENDHLVNVVGTSCTGSGAARADFVMRCAKQAKDIASLAPYLDDVAKMANETAEKETIVIECSQSTFLSLALSSDYPYVTSDNCTATAAADDVGLHWRNISGVLMVVKAVPSRVGEGPLPGELSEEDIKKHGIEEFGVNTKRPRRKSYEIPWEMLKYATMLNSPTEIALTFCDHYDPEVVGVRSINQLTNKVWNLIEKVEEVTKAPVTIVETGKLFDHIIDLRGVSRSSSNTISPDLCPVGINRSKWGYS